MTVCSQCSVELPPENDFVVCNCCNSKLHYNCANVRETVWRNYTAKVKLLWKCAGCKTKTALADNKPADKDSKIESKIECPGFNEVDYLRDLLRHKDIIIRNQADLIMSLKDQIGLMKAHQAYKNVPPENKPIHAPQRSESRRTTSNVVGVPPKGEKPQSGWPVKDKQPADDECEVSDALPRRSENGDGTSSTISNCDMHMALTRTKLQGYINLNESPEANKRPRGPRSKRENQTIIGKKSADGNSSLRAAESYSHWHVYRLHPETKPEDVLAYLQADFPKVQVEKLDSVSPEVYSSFRVSVRENDVQKILNPDLWPSGARVNRFFLPRRK